MLDGFACSHASLVIVGQRGASQVFIHQNRVTSSIPQPARVHWAVRGLA